jgi:hypothetical protein
MSMDECGGMGADERRRWKWIQNRKWSEKG